MNRTLKLRREVLSELPAIELAAVAGGTTGAQSVSCYTFVSCNPLDCLTRYPTLLLDTVRRLTTAVTDQCVGER